MLTLYLAVSRCISLYLPARRGQWMLTRETHAPAITRFLSRPLPGEEAADGSGARRDLRGFLLLPRTGKTHQLRVALKSLGTPQP